LDVGGGLELELVGVGDADDEVGLGDADVGVGEGSTGSPCNTSRYEPYPEAELHPSADSTAVPSPHSLNVVTSWNCALDDAIAATWFFQRDRSRVSRGVASPFYQNPGEIVYE